MFARLSTSAPDWDQALAALRSALAQTPHPARLQHALSWFYSASQNEIEACIETIQDLNDLTRSRINETLVKRYRQICRDVHRLTRKELPRVASSLVAEYRDLDTVRHTLTRIENNSYEALSYFNAFVSKPSPQRQVTAVRKLIGFSRSLGAWI